MAEPKELRVERIFDAPVEKVWAAWTEPEQVKKWWGPHGYDAPEIKIDFKVGGKYLNAMRGPAGPGGPIVTAWSGGEYKEIVPMKKIVVTDYFSNEKGEKTSAAEFGLSEDFPLETTITITFEELDGKTKLTINYPLPDDEKAREAMIGSGMEEGWGQSLDKLAEAIK